MTRIDRANGGPRAAKVADVRLPELSYGEWRETYETLHLFTQIVGKIRLAQMPWLNHTWQVTLYPTARGLGTGRMPHREMAFEIDFDFVEHALQIATARGDRRSLPLRAEPVASFYRSVMESLTALGIPVRIYPKPSEVESGLPFEDDMTHRTYDREAVERWWRILAWTTDAFVRFRSSYYGKASPVHFFWGGFDLAVTRFSGRIAPRHPSTSLLPDHVVQDAYSHEVSSCGFWPGGPATPYPMFYSYAYPEPVGLAEAEIRPREARWDTGLREFVLPYDAVRTSAEPTQALLSFLESSYVAAADLGGWDRGSLEVPAEPRRIARSSLR